MTTTKLSSSLLSLIEDHVSKVSVPDGQKSSLQDQTSKTTNSLTTLQKGGQEADQRTSTFGELVKTSPSPMVGVKFHPMLRLAIHRAKSVVGPKGSNGSIVLTITDHAAHGVSTDTNSYLGAQVYTNDVQAVADFTAVAPLFDQFRVLCHRVAVFPINGLNPGTVGIVYDADNIGSTSYNVGNQTNAVFAYPAHKTTYPLHLRAVGSSTTTIVPWMDAKAKPGVAAAQSISSSKPVSRMGTWMNASSGSGTVSGVWLFSGIYQTYSASTAYFALKSEWDVEFSFRL